MLSGSPSSISDASNWRSVMKTKGLIESALEHERARASVKAVFGEPLSVDGRTFIPVAKMPADASAGAAAQPLGVVEISGARTRYVGFAQTKRFAWIAGISAALGLLVGRVLGKRGWWRAGF
jgi:hypothetical protein